MATGTKSSAGSKLAGFVALIVLLGFGYGLVKRIPSDERSGALFSVVFESKTRVIAVNIVILVDGVLVHSAKPRKSPWEQLVLLNRGQTAVLTAEQKIPARLSCAVNGEVQEIREFPGIVTCAYRRA